MLNVDDYERRVNFQLLLQEFFMEFFFAFEGERFEIPLEKREREF